MAKKDLVDLRLGVGVNISLSYGDQSPSEEDRETRRLHSQTCAQIKDELEAELLVRVGEALGYDNETLKKKIGERAEKEQATQEAEEAGRKLRADQRAGRV